MTHRANPILIHFCISAVVLCVASSTFAQTKTQSVYVSEVDRDLAVKAVAVAPFSDNVSGIYAKPLAEHLREKLAKDPQWTLVPFAGDVGRIENLEARPADVRRVLDAAKANALFTGRVTKGPSGLSLKVSFNVGSSGLPLLMEESSSLERSDLPYLKTLLSSMVERIRERMPYRGTLMSRRGQEVTINIGKNSGLTNSSTISVVQVLKVNRHPKKSFMIGAEREILGKVKVFKADDELSFGNVVFEKEAGLLAAGMKVLPDEVVHYPQGPASNPAFGEKPIEWLPEPPPQYGRVQLLAGLGQYTQSASFAAAGGVTGANSLTPNLGLFVEGWLNTEWFLSFDLRQSAFSVSNDYPSGSPAKLNVSLSKYAVGGGYNFLLSPDFFGPKIQLSAGLGKFTADVDEGSPVSFTNMSYGGMYFGMLFNTPIDRTIPWDLGARLRYYWSPGLTESVSSGSTKSVSAMDFGFLVARRVRQNFRYVGGINFESYSSDYSGAGDRSTDPVSDISHRLTTLMVGLEYAF